MANVNLQFRLATPEDAAQLQQMVESAFRAEDSRPNWTADMELGSRFRVDVEKVRAQIAKPDGGILMATDDDGRLVASVEIVKTSPGVARLSMVAVGQQYQQGGVGRQLLAHAEGHCRRAWGVAKIGLNALSSRQELISWYMRRGYRKTGEETPFPFGRVDGMASAEGLTFVELEKDLDLVADQVV